MLDSEHNDLRADSISLGKLLHAKPMYAVVRYTSVDPRWGWSTLFRKTIEHNVSLTVSLEVLSQLLTAKNLPLGSTDEVAAERIKLAAQSLHSVSINRYLAVEGINVVQDTTLVAFALYKQMVERRRMVPFPVFKPQEP